LSAIEGQLTADDYQKVEKTQNVDELCDPQYPPFFVFYALGFYVLE